MHAGEWRAGKYSGQGTLTYNNGNVYIGSFSFGKLHGRGILTYANSDVFEGEFKEGKRNGPGRLRSHDEQDSVVEGVWLDDKRLTSNGSSPLPSIGSNLSRSQPLDDGFNNA